jgi:short-subunit dehydrogenase
MALTAIHHINPGRNLRQTPIKNIVITGASSGLGEGLALSYAQPGVTLGLIGRNEARLHATAEACRARGATVEAATIDVADAPAIGKWLLMVDARAPLDLVIANAGIAAGPPGIATTEGLDAAIRQISVNLLGTMHTLEPVLPLMLARGHGHIAVVASVAAYRGLPYSPAYCASKAGVRAYGEALRALLAPGGIAVSVLIPGFFDSRMSERYLGAKPLRLSTAQAVTAARRGLDRRAARIVFPRILGLLLQAADLLPARLGDRILRAVRFRIAAT